MRKSNKRSALRQVPTFAIKYNIYILTSCLKKRYYTYANVALLLRGPTVVLWMHEGYFGHIARDTHTPLYVPFRKPKNKNELPRKPPAIIYRRILLSYVCLSIATVHQSTWNE